MTLGHKLEQAVEELELDLKGRTVLTEAATGPYVVTPVLALLAGARVYAYTKPTRYGTVAEVCETTLSLAHALELDQDRLTILDSLPGSVVAEADVITNSGHLRPLDERLMQHARPGCVVSLMYESWEIRDEDLDLDFLKRKGIRAVATNERHPNVDVFSYLGELAVRQIHLAGLSLARNRFVLYCNNPFGPYLARTLSALCAELIVVTEGDDTTSYEGLPVTRVDRIQDVEPDRRGSGIAGIVLAANPFEREWIGSSGVIRPELVSQHLPGAVVLRFAGHVDEVSLRRHGIGFYPASVPVGHMGSLLSELGPDPVIRLQSGGLKAAEVALSGGYLFRSTPILEWL